MDEGRLLAAWSSVHAQVLRGLLRLSVPSLLSVWADGEDEVSEVTACCGDCGCPLEYGKEPVVCPMCGSELKLVSFDA